MATAAPSTITAEQFGKRPDPGHPEELVRGRIVRMPPPNRRHGQVCGNAYFLLRLHAAQYDLGHVLSNDSGVITERNPDTVRGADVAFYSYSRLPKGPLPQTYGPEVPELIIEVRSPGDRWPEVLAKVTEYLNAGVVVVIVLDPDSRSAQVYRVDQPPRILQDDDELTVPDLLGDFRVAVRRFFD
ncbi:Uma2 family endonuclease [Tautonia sociabilis]|uniref:Uma2 family endonuclease n=1 Tax=Tautonia sociabilis TaxID=2080755 RepID=A0A432MJF8_9BACT|nr:Uma2 family endonuclease [Tautonia sociabilis]RUL87534.1 Uma2 family endonuclease [Tautonia sociabilis]